VNYGYLTLFAYFEEFEKGRISRDTLESKMNIEIKCGFLSYAKTPFCYNKILGVTGTLSQINPLMKATLSNYNFNILTYAPSIFGSSKITFNKTSDFVSIEPSYANWIVKIKGIV
jgi:hypothetical protein